jgi:cation diffusion facilitator CzcD-associated flavoprotein CzcO
LDKKIDTIIVGAGQAGLSLSYYLWQAGREHPIELFRMKYRAEQDLLASPLS